MTSRANFFPNRLWVVRRSPLARPLTAVIAAVLVSGALAGCTGFSVAGGCQPVYEPGDASNAITATGDVGESPAVEFPTPLIADGLERSVTTVGSGETAAPGAAVLYDYVYYNATTGEAITEGTAQLGSASDAALALGEALACATAGSRVVLAGPAEDIDARAEGATETMVAVIDVRSVFLGKANGVNQLPQDGMPQVVTAVDGEPGITLTYQAAPQEPRSALIKAGAGATLQDGDQVIAHVRTWTWPAGVGSTASLGTDDTWANGIPTTVDLSEGVVDEFVYEAFEGTKVGSQLLIVRPAQSGDGSATVLVIDILGILADE
jgi:hypothetical protein